MILDDLAQVVYAPAKAFRKIVENPKYLGAIIVLLLFLAVSIGFEFVQFSKIYTENTSPVVGNLQSYINATSWTSTPNVNITNNYADPFNYSVYVAAVGNYYSIFGNASLQISAANSNNVMAAIENVFNVDCNSPSGFQNLSMAIKQVSPSATPQSATLTLYSLTAANYYTYDLTSSLDSASNIGVWNNLTIPLGPNAHGWSKSGLPSWGNITDVQFSLTYPSNSNITVRVGSLFFRDQYQTPVRIDTLGLLLQFLQAYGFQFILAWFILTGLIYLFFRGLKTTVSWKPLFVSLGFALFILVIREAADLVAAATLPVLHYPYDVSLGVRFNTLGATYYPIGASNLTSQSQAILNHINSATAGFQTAILVIFAVAYLWLGALCTMIIGTLKPELSMPKRIVISGVSIAITLLLLLLLVGLA